jgi:hypothetical protein
MSSYAARIGKISRATASNSAETYGGELRNVIDQVGLIIVAQFHGQLRQTARPRTFDALQQSLKPRDSGQAFPRKAQPRA